MPGIVDDLVAPEMAWMIGDHLVSRAPSDRRAADRAAGDVAARRRSTLPTSHGVARRSRP